MMLAQPTFLALFLLVPLLSLVCLASWRRRNALLAQLASAGMLTQLVGPGIRVRRILQAVFAVIAVGGMALAASGPRWGFEWQQQRMEGVTIAVVLDISRSMDAQDISPSRMEFARRKLGDFSRLLRGDAVGLVIFAAGAYLRLPPTVDYDTFRWTLDDSDTSTIRSQGTSLAGAIDVATKMLDRAEGSGKAMLLVSDGEGHDEQESVDAAVAKAKAASVHIYALGVGTPDGAPIPLPNGGFKKDGSGNLVVSKLDEDRLKALAAATGGAYVRAVASEDDVQTLYEQEIRGKLQASDRGVRQEKLWHERFQWPLALAFACALVSSAMSIGWRGRLPWQRAAVLVLLLLPLAAWAGAATDGLSAWKAGDWEKAIPLLGQARVDDPGNREVARALAESLYRSGRYREAESVFRSLADSAPNDKEHAVYDYDAGDAAYHAGRLNEALQNFQQSSQRDPGFADAKKNADVVQKELAMRLQQQPPPKQDQKDQQDQQNQQDQQSQPDQQAQNQDQQQQGQSQQSQQAQNGQQQKDPNSPTAGQNQQDPQSPKSQDPNQQAQNQQPTDPSELDNGQGTPAQEADAGDDPDKMSKEQAARLVDSVQDGKPRVTLGGASSGRDW